MAVLINPSLPSLATQNLATFIEYSRWLIEDPQTNVLQTGSLIAESNRLMEQPRQFRDE
ncbi:MAG: hypothetical protein WA476_17805 [Acidobacteriaceae bacterium]